MKPLVLHFALAPFALSLCAPTPARAQMPCVGTADVCGEWAAAQQLSTRPYFELTAMILLETGDVL